MNHLWSHRITIWQMIIPNGATFGKLNKYLNVTNVLMTQIIYINDLNSLPFGGSWKALALHFSVSSQNNGAEVRGRGREGFWELDFLVNRITVGKRPRYRSQSALGGHGHKACTQSQQQQLQCQWYGEFNREVVWSRSLGLYGIYHIWWRVFHIAWRRWWRGEVVLPLLFSSHSFWLADGLGSSTSLDAAWKTSEKMERSHLSLRKKRELSFSIITIHSNNQTGVVALTFSQ